MFKYSVEDHELRKTQSWILSEDYSEIEQWEKPLIDAHLRIADMFISYKPFILFGIDAAQPKHNDGMIADGVYLVDPIEIEEPSDCILVNTLFLNECLQQDDKTVFEMIIEFGYILDEATITEFLLDSSNKNGMHCAYVYKKNPKKLEKPKADTKVIL